ncbi:MAG: ABC transporter substrate-binding protein [Spirochaetales bacterium]|nr:ABC transporter substrate-binding protein [Spirochaetales bacterium]
MSFLKDKIIILLICVFVLTFSSCSKKASPNRITIAEQYGLAYAPLQIMREKGFLEEINPRAEVHWVTLGNTAAIREAALAGDVDAGFLGIPPYLISYDKGMTWKIATGLSQSPLGLVVNDDLINGQNEFDSKTLLALPQPGSIQHILLAMGLENQYGEHDRWDEALVSMNHPDGMNALFNGAVAGHFTSPPYLFREMDESGYSLYMTGREAMGGPFTFIVGVVTEDFYNHNPGLYRDYLKALDQSIDFIKRNRKETLEILGSLYELEPEVLSDYLYDRGMVYSQDVLGLEVFLDFMAERDMISDDISPEEVFFEAP